MKKISLLIITFVTIFSAFSAKAQSDINRINYFKYVVIPAQFKFQDEQNKYLLNSLTKHLFNEENYVTYMDIEKKPKDLTFNKCLALYVDVISESESFFSLQTQLDLILKDCNGEVIFKNSGHSKIKSFKESYQDALKDAFTPLKNFNYAYNGKNTYDSSSLYTENVNEKENGVIEKPKENNKPSVEDQLVGSYSLLNEKYTVSKIEAGYILINDETGNKKAFINITSNHSILFNSDDINGTLIINDKNNLEIEYFNKNSGEVEKVTLYRLN